MKTASIYFKELADNICKTKVTNKHNHHISIDKGTELATDMIISVKSRSKKVIIIGNGGSAAIASHVQNDLCKAVGVRGMVFTEQPLLMALANDDGYDTIFQNPMELWTEPLDLLISISSSGSSQNILYATQTAIKNKCHVITMSGFNEDNPLRKMGDLNFYLPSNIYGQVETGHSAITHFITDNAKNMLNNTSGK